MNFNIEPVQSGEIIVGQNHKKPAQKNTRHMQNAHFTIQTRASGLQLSWEIENWKDIDPKNESIRSECLIQRWTIRFDQ